MKGQVFKSYCCRIKIEIMNIEKVKLKGLERESITDIKDRLKKGIRLSAADTVYLLGYIELNKKILEKEIIDKMQIMCEESLPPCIFEKWEEVKMFIELNRKINK